MKSIDWNQVEDVREFDRPSPGGYICQITVAEDIPAKEYIKIEYDIAYGDYKGFWRQLYENKGFWGGSFIKSYKPTALPFFKAFKTAVEESNKGYEFNNDEKTLVDKYVGLVLAEEEYLTNKNEVKTRLYVASVRGVDAIKNNDFEVPPLKKMALPSTKESNDFIPVSNDEKLPWE